MKYFRTFAILVFLILSVTYLLASNETRIREMVSSNQPSQTEVNRPKITPTKPKPPPISFPNVLKLADTGDFSVKRISPPKRKPVKKVKTEKKIEDPPKTAAPEPKRQPPPEKIEKTVRAEPPVSAVPVSTRENTTEDTRPQFEIGYDYIGLSQYLIAVEKIGSLYILTGENGDHVLGPEISFLERRLEANKDDSNYRNEHLAIQRPYLVRDAQLPAYLENFALPAAAYKDRLVLYLTKPFDALLWDKVQRALNKRNHKLSDITSVKGQYVRLKQNLTISMTTARTKAGKDIEIEAALKLPCGTCL